MPIHTPLCSPQQPQPFSTSVCALDFHTNGITHSLPSCIWLALSIRRHPNYNMHQNHVSFSSTNGFLGWSLFLQGLIGTYHCPLSFEYSCPCGCDVSRCFWAAFLTGCWTYFHTLKLPSLYFLWRNIDERPLTSFRVDYLFIFTLQKFFKYSVQLLKSLLKALICVFFDSLHGLSAFFEDIVAQMILTKLETKLTKLCISLLLFMVLVFYFK